LLLEFSERGATIDSERVQIRWHIADSIWFCSVCTAIVHLAFCHYGTWIWHNNEWWIPIDAWTQNQYCLQCCIHDYCRTSDYFKHLIVIKYI
jgi:hypothetical protein